MCDETDEEEKVFQQTKQKEEEKILNNGEREGGLTEERKAKKNGMESQTGQVMCVRLTSEEVEIEKKRICSEKEMETTGETGRKGSMRGKAQKKKIGEGLWPHFSSF